MFAIMLDNRPIGELQLKQIDWEKEECTLSIHMQNDIVKEKGFGTQAELMAVKYAFDELGILNTIALSDKSQFVGEFN